MAGTGDARRPRVRRRCRGDIPGCASVSTATPTTAGTVRCAPARRRPTREPWPIEPRPVLEHARSLDVDDLYLETCYLPEPETIDDRMLDAGPVRVGFSWGHPWPAGAFHGLDGGRTPAAEDHLARWVTAAARLGHPVMRITLGSPASRGTEPASVLVDRLIEPTRRAAERGGAGRPRGWPSRTTATCGRRTSSRSSSGPAPRTWA